MAAYRGDYSVCITHFVSHTSINYTEVLEIHTASIFSATFDLCVANSEAGGCIFPPKSGVNPKRTRSQNTELMRHVNVVKGNVIPLQAWCGPEGG